MARILVVDDEQAVCQLLEELLADEGYTVVTAGNGKEALARLVDGPPDLVITDVMMPLMGGPELCDALARDPSMEAIPVVVMSAAGEPGARQPCRYAAFVAKPFTLLALLETVERVLRDSART